MGLNPVASGIGVQLLDSQVAVGIDADVAGNVEAGFDDLASRQLGVHQQGARGGLRVGATGTDGDQPFFRLDDIAVAGDDQRGVLVGDGKQGFQLAQGAVGAPVLGQLDGGADEVALVFFQLGFKAFEQGKGIGGTTGETGNDLILVEAAYLAGVAWGPTLGVYPRGVAWRA